jgi:deoxyribodipyrimidine photo-lyase
MFTPSLSAAQQQLDAFIPNAGAYYAQHRNFDFGLENRANVSILSPYIRRRVLT